MEPPFSFKRHHHNHHPPPPPPPPQQQQQQKPSPPETLFRILCPATKAGGIIGKGGAVIRQLRDETGARIRIIDEFVPPHCEERVILIVAPSSDSVNPNSGDENGGVSSVAQMALVRVFERILKVDEERSERNEENGFNGGEVNGGMGHHVVCRLLAPSHQVGCVLGRGGKIVEKIRQESGARVRVLPRESIPSCASPGDELIQITGNFQAVKKALLSVSSCLQEHPKADMFQGANNLAHADAFPQRGTHASDFHSRGYPTGSAPENFGPNNGMVVEEDVIFRLLCQADKIGSLIGKGGSIIRAIQTETGASIKIGDAIAPDSAERVVVISARESLDLKHSPAQDAVIRVHNRVAEVGFEPGAAVVARLVVPTQQIGCLLGKGGHIIAEMRRLTGASIRIFGREHGSKFSTPNDEIVQVIGSVQSVQDALFQITSRVREIVFPPRPHISHVSGPPYMNTFPELPSPSFRPRHDQASPGHYHAPAGFSHSYDNRSAGQGQAHPSGLTQGTDRTGVANSENERHHYAGDRASYGQFERPPSPRAWHHQAVNNANSTRFPDTGPGPSGMVTTSSESGQMQIMTSVEVVVPQILLPHVYGENKTNLGHITQFSGAEVVVHDPKPGATEGLVVISGSASQLHAAQSLLQAFILCGQAF